MQCHAIPCNTMQCHAMPCIINNSWRSVPLPCGQYNGHFSSSSSSFLFLYLHLYFHFYLFQKFPCPQGRTTITTGMKDVGICKIGLNPQTIAPSPNFLSISIFPMRYLWHLVINFLELNRSSMHCRSTEKYAGCSESRKHLFQPQWKHLRSFTTFGLQLLWIGKLLFVHQVGVT